MTMGGRLLAGGGQDGAIVQPTVMDNVAPDSDLIAHETFGPVLAIRTFADLDAAIGEINAGPYGLQAGVNEGPDFRAEHVPFGGVKSSGIGREGVRIALREMSETRVTIG